MNYESPEQADEALRNAGWKRIMKGVYGKGDSRAYVNYFADHKEQWNGARRVSVKRTGWNVSFWPPVTMNEGRKKREELGGKAWM